MINLLKVENSFYGINLVTQQNNITFAESGEQPIQL